MRYFAAVRAWRCSIAAARSKVLHRPAPRIWAGCFGESANGLPLIGAIPGSPHCYAVLGYGGNGISFSVIAAQMIQRAILGLPDPDSNLFALWA